MGAWHLIAGEYPPKFGGVSAYTALLAGGLADAGESVHVWAIGPSQPGDDPRVHRVGHGWSPAAFGRLGAALDGLPGPRRLLVQYAPNSFGAKGMNVGLCRWLAGRKRRGDDVRVIFHELWYFPRPGDRPARLALSAVQRLMARSLLNSCTGYYVTIPRWAELLGSYRAGRDRPWSWLPVPSNIPVADDPGSSSSIRQRVTGGMPGRGVVGHFGTFSGPTADLLADALPRVLNASSEAVALLIGPGGESFAAKLAGADASLHGRLAATGALDEAAVSHHLAACDLLLQPYPGGVTSRRGSVMAALAHGRPVVTTSGDMTEPVWSGSGSAAVATAPEGDAEGLARLTAALLADPDARAKLGEAGLQTYRREFALERTVEALIGRGERQAR